MFIYDNMNYKVCMYVCIFICYVCMYVYILQKSFIYNESYIVNLTTYPQQYLVRDIIANVKYSIV